MKITILTVLMTIICIPALANQSIKYCYNCRVSSQQRVEKPYINVNSAPVTYPVASVIRQINPYYPVYIEAMPAIAQGPNCWLQPDPYTFLGDIFGYDYIYMCQ